MVKMKKGQENDQMGGRRHNKGHGRACNDLQDQTPRRGPLLLFHRWPGSDVKLGLALVMVTWRTGLSGQNPMSSSQWLGRWLDVETCLDLLPNVEGVTTGLEPQPGGALRQPNMRWHAAGII